MKEPTVGHYVPKMIEDWRRLYNRVEGRRRTSSGDEIMKSAELIIEALEMGVCWTISKTAFPLVWNTDITSLDFENQRLPFPTMCIEYDFDYEHVGVSKERLKTIADPAYKRIIILTEISETQFALISCYQPAYKPDIDIDWSISPVTIVFEYKQFDHMEKWLNVNNEQLRMAFNTLDGDSPMITCSAPMFQETFDKFTDEELQGIMTDLADEIRMSFGLLGILSCNNAPVKEILPPAKLNKKRVSRGKAPLPTYRTLHVSDHTVRGGKTSSDGTHASPKTHWRRGHIRNQPTAKGYIRKWIKPTIVGSGVAPKPEVVLT